jgi:hypothetical protein
MQLPLSLRQGYLNFVVQQVALRTFIYLEGGIDHQVGMDSGKPQDFVVYFVMKEFLVGTPVFFKRLRFNKVPIALLVIFLIIASGAFI